MNFILIKTHTHTYQIGYTLMQILPRNGKFQIPKTKQKLRISYQNRLFSNVQNGVMNENEAEMA